MRLETKSLLTFKWTSEIPVKLKWWKILHISEYVYTVINPELGNQGREGVDLMQEEKDLSLRGNLFHTNGDKYMKRLARGIV